MADLRKHSSTSNLIRFTLKNSSTGVGLTGLSSASSGLIISTICDNEAVATTYTVAGSTIETITTLGTFAAPTAAKCRFKEVDATNHKGLYEFQIADARFSVASAKRLIISVTGATSLLDADYEIQLVSFDLYTAIAQTGDGYAILTNGTYGLSAIENLVDSLETTIGAAGAGLTAIPWNVAWDAEVQSECADALVAYGASTHSAADVWAVATRALTDKSGFAIGTGGISSTAFAASAIDAAALATDAGQEIADRVLSRNIASGSDGGRDVRSALRPLRNKVAIAGGTATVYAENDADVAWTAAVTTAAGNPMDSIDPA